MSNCSTAKDEGRLGRVLVIVGTIVMLSTPTIAVAAPRSVLVEEFTSQY